MWHVYWLALGAFSTLMTLLWLVVSPYERVYFTAGMGGVGWVLMALTAPGVSRLTEAGTTVQAPVSEPLQLFVGLLGFLSLVVVVLYRFDEYPPPDYEQ